MTSTICSVAQCLRPHYAKGLCNAHWQRQRAGRPLVEIQRGKVYGDHCAFEDCGRKTSCRGWCDGHYRQIRLGNLPRHIKEKIDQKGYDCIVIHCDNLAVSKSLCQRHFRSHRKFNLTDVEIVALFADPKCAICETTDSGARDFHIDHDHACCDGPTSCGKCVRGLLCGFCNRGLGSFRDKPARLQQAIDYLARCAA